MIRDRDRRGVSEVIAFVIIFGIIVGSVALLYTSGFTALTSMQEHEQMQNADRAMSALAANLNDVERDGITERRGELELREGSVTVGEDGTRLTIEIERGAVVLDDDPIGSITYSDGSSSIAYQGGGVFRGDRTGSVSSREPRMVCADNDGETVAIVSLIEVNAEPRTIQSSGGIELEALQRNSTVVTETDGANVTVTVEDSSYANGWANALERNDWDGPGPTYFCDAERATIRVVSVDVTL